MLKWKLRDIKLTVIYELTFWQAFKDLFQLYSLETHRFRDQILVSVGSDQVTVGPGQAIQLNELMVNRYTLDQNGCHLTSKSNH